MFVTEMTATAGVGAAGGLADGGRALLQRAVSQTGEGLRGAIGRFLPKQGCFLEGTPVLTPDGPVAIDALRAGDQVLAVEIDENGDVLGLTPQLVTGTSVRQVEALVELTLSVDGAPVPLITTPDHPFFVPDLGVYVRAEHLREGAGLLTLEGVPVTLEGRRVLPGAVTVYNLEVEPSHNYFVTVDGVALLVHNGGCSRRLAKNLEAAGFVRPEGHAAHHIVAKGADRAEKTREVLERLGIGIDDAANGVFLPQVKDIAKATGSAYHRKLHTNVYYDQVAQMLQHVKTKSGAVRVLSRIGQSLSKGKFPS